MGEAVAHATGVIRRLMREARFGALGTLEADGAPYASLVAVAPDAEGAPTLLMSGLARHTRNLQRDPRASLLLTGGAAGDPLNAPRASLLGRIAVAPDRDARIRFLARHPEAAGYADFTDFAFYRLDVREAHLVEGFGRIVTLPASGLLTSWEGAEAVRAAVEGVMDHMNADHADAVALYATRLLGEAEAPDAVWRMVGLDPEGCEIAAGETVRRLEFPQRVTDVAAVRQVLVALVTQARRMTN